MYISYLQVWHLILDHLFHLSQVLLAPIFANLDSGVLLWNRAGLMPWSQQMQLESSEWSHPWLHHCLFLELSHEVVVPRFFKSGKAFPRRFSPSSHHFACLCQLQQTFPPGTLEWCIEEDEGQTNFCKICQSRLRKLRVLWWKRSCHDRVF
jgi:hypothetical protein